MPPPPYSTFGQFALFISEIGDFGLSWRDFNRMISACGVASMGGLLIGDTAIMFRKHATDKKYLTYDNLCEIARVVEDRVKRVQDAQKDIPWVPVAPPTHQEPTLPLPGNKSATGGSEETVPVHQPFGGGACGLAVKLNPPSLVREPIPLPECKQARLAAKMKGVQVLLYGGELSRAKYSLPQLREEIRDVFTDSEGPTESDSPKPIHTVESPMNIQIWLELVTAEIGLGEGRHDDARGRIRMARALIGDASSNAGAEYKHILCAFEGFCSFYECDYEAAITDFRRAHRAALDSASPVDPVARRYAAISMHNVGVCFQLTGRHTNAVRAYRDAQKLFGTGAAGTANIDPAYDALVRNMSRALRMGLGVPRIAQPEKEHILKCEEGSSNLFEFLKEAVPLTPSKPPQPTVKTDAKSDTKSGKSSKKKGGGKKGKKEDNKKGGKKKGKGLKGPAKLPSYAPHYGIENAVSGAAKKGKRHKK